MTSLADQGLAQLGGRSSVLSRQKRDHVRLDELLEQLSRAPAADQKRVLLRIYRLVFPHAFAEESVLWPTIRRVLPDGEPLTLQVEREHQEINELVMRLESLAPGSTDWDVALTQVVALLRQDVRDEEDVLLPRLQRKLTPGQLRRLGFTWEAVRRVAPTRAHPFVARRPPGNVLSALPLSIIDRVRDVLDALAYRGGRADVGALSTLSDALGRAAHVLERTPGLGAGEHPSTRRRSGTRWLGVAMIALVAGSAAMVAVRRRRLAAEAATAAGR
ncbi:hemerythrin domain-containing protein [Phenylobacterium sp.]|jgi:hypothetical protein|uniref:hemerythrin domain-containing protein n=1 Tax=Phenylobacterium sp. TaxID=1871053 RepID=UPI002F944EB9